LRRERSTIDSKLAINPRQNTGVFTIGAHPEEDGKVGACSFVRLWTGVECIDTLTDDLPPSTVFPLFYFAEVMPFFWSK